MSVAAGTPTSNIVTTNSVDSLDITAPGDLAENHIDLIVGAFSASDTTDYTTPSGFTRYLATAPGGNNEVGAFFGDRLAPSSPGTVNLVHGVVRRAIVSRVGISGVDTSDPRDVISGSLTAGSSSEEDAGFTVTVPALTTTVANTLAVACVAFGNTGGVAMTSFTFPSGWTELYFNKTGSGNGNCAMVWGYKAIASEGTTGDFAVPYQRAGGANLIYWKGAMIAYQPPQGDPAPVIVRRPRFIGL